MDRNRYELFKIATMLPIPLRCSVKAKMTDNFEKKTIERRRNEEYKNNGIRKRRKEKRKVGPIQKKKVINGKRIGEDECACVRQTNRIRSAKQ